MTGSRVLTDVGVLISATGIVDLVQSQIRVADLKAAGEPLLSQAVYRWQYAGSAVVLIALGILIAISAPIMGILRTIRDRLSEPSESPNGVDALGAAREPARSPVG